ncbi:phosphoenolpyruvate carboxykinase (ATP) [Tepidiforma sp.]|uniref:phosphoenolpyruvate carboxykinase (ATP) n=1 Tax=Tepidiforma sp. TaxID=2682230 RepID=UPI002ADD33E4|nr:phosphoenolpyruvate carboxykinase (ATP) [Tepidiforma sp.]
MAISSAPGNVGSVIIENASEVHHNLSVPVLYEYAVRRREGKLLQGGTFAVFSGERTGRSPQDKFVVKTPEISEHVWWGKHNQPLPVDTYRHLEAKAIAYLRGRELFVQDTVVSQDPAHRKTVRVITEQAYHSLFARTMFIPSDKRPFEEKADLTIIHCPFLHLGGEADGVRSDAVVALNLTEGVILIAGTAYAGEMKKAVFTAMNYYLPLEGILSLHSAANVDPRTGKSALFFGLSGTGKTTLSTDPERLLVGDDEHAWTERGVFNIEGGCYAKTIRLSKEAEPDIFEQTHEFGTILENVIFDEDTREVDLDDASITENTRGSYPLESLKHVYLEPVAPHPSHVILLTADAFGVLPPIARLTPEQALYHFLSGYTSKLAGTEVGLKDPEITFSPCYGAPFMALNPTVYAELLEQRLRATGAQTWLINTGWTGGRFGVGKRIAILETRRMVRAVLNDLLTGVEFRRDPVFGFEVPLSCPGVDTRLLTPRETWADPDEYDRAYRGLAEKFAANFEQFRSLVRPEVAAAGP